MKRKPQNTAFKRLWRNKIGRISALMTAFFLLLALGMESYSVYCSLANQVPVYAVEHAERNASPSPRHWCGTDYMGRDVLWRAAAGTTTAVKVGVIGAFIAVAIGTLLGMVAGYCGGWVDDMVVWLYSVFAAMPTLLFILAFALLVNRGFLSPEVTARINAVAAAFNADPGTLAVYLAIGLTGWVGLCIVVRAETMKLRERGFVLAARVAGVGTFAIIRRHILPNVMHLVIIYFTLRFAYAIMTEVIVSFLGVGVQSAPSWGVMIADAQERSWRGMWEMGTATVFMFLLVLGLQLLGDTLRDVLDPRHQEKAS